MSVIIDHTCITCNACIEVCPVNAISDDSNNPLGNPYYYVHPEKCVECVGIHEDPQCAAICPSIGCITWDMPFTKEFNDHYVNSPAYKLGEKNGELRSPEFKQRKYREDIPLTMRGVGHPVQEEPEELKEANS